MSEMWQGVPEILTYLMLTFLLIGFIYVGVIESKRTDELSQKIEKISERLPEAAIPEKDKIQVKNEERPSIKPQETLRDQTITFQETLRDQREMMDQMQGEVRGRNQVLVPIGILILTLMIAAIGYLAKTQVDIRERLTKIETIVDQLQRGRGKLG